MKEISVVIPCLIVSDDLYEQAKEAVKTIRTENVEVILVNNGSTIDEDFFKLNSDIYIRYPQKIGFGAACNAGLKLARGKYLAISSIDVKYLKGGLEDLMEQYQNINDIGVVCPSGLNKGQGIDDKLHVNETEGSTFLFSREVYNKVKLPEGLYDERYEHGYFEDRDLWERIKRCGLLLVRSGFVLMNHGEGTTNKHLGVLEKYMEINKKKFIDKWGFEPDWTG